MKYATQYEGLQDPRAVPEILCLLLALQNLEHYAKRCSLHPPQAAVALAHQSRIQVLVTAFPLRNSDPFVGLADISPNRGIPSMGGCHKVS